MKYKIIIDPPLVHHAVVQVVVYIYIYIYIDVMCTHVPIAFCFPPLAVVKLLCFL